MVEASFVVTGAGMRTPVGNDAPGTCAALRAGVSRLAAWPHLSFAGEPIAVGAVRPGHSDAAWNEKAVPLLSPAIHEALWQAGLYAHSWHRRRVGLFVATPPRSRTGVHPRRVADTDEYLGDVWLRLANNEFVRRTERLHVGGAVALAQACEALASDELDAAVVAGVESYLDSYFLDELLTAGRLRTAESPHGIVPGEGAAAIVLETAEAARRRQAPALARLVALVLEQEAAGWSPSLPSRAEALTRALQAALAVEPGPAAYHRLLVDLTGERWRAREWALAEPRALAALPAGWQTWHPVDSIGDVGPAFVPLAIGWATQAFARRYAGPGGILVGALNETGERAAVALMPA